MSWIRLFNNPTRYVVTVQGVSGERALDEHYDEIGSPLEAAERVSLSVAAPRLIRVYDRQTKQAHIYSFTEGGIALVRSGSNKITFLENGEPMSWTRLFENPRWTRKYIDELPDSAFLYVDKSRVTHRKGGRSHPLDARHLPVKDRRGNYNCAHLKNAISRAVQTNLPSSVQKKLQQKARRLYYEQCG